MINSLICGVCMTATHGGQDPHSNHSSAESRTGTPLPPSASNTRTGGTNTVVQVRTSLPRQWSDRLDHLGIELGMSKARLLQEAALLLLRFHDRGAGLPEPIDSVNLVAEVCGVAQQHHSDQLPCATKYGLGTRTQELPEPMAPRTNGESDGR